MEYSAPQLMADFAPWEGLYGHLSQQKATLDKMIIRAADIAISLSMLLFLAPILLIVSGIILVSSPGPLVFSQKRIGFGGKYFSCFKFRSMVVDAEADWPNCWHRILWRKRNGSRITSSGTILASQQ